MQRCKWMLLAVTGLMVAGEVLSAAKPTRQAGVSASQPIESVSTSTTMPVGHAPKMTPPTDTRRLDNTYYQWRTDLPKPEGNVVSIAGPKALKAAFNSAKGGETLLLAPGNYGHFSVRKRTFEKPVTLRSADPKKPAVFSGMKLGSAAGLNIKDIEFRATPEMGQGKFFMLLRIDNASRIRISHCFFIGTPDAREDSKTRGYFVGMGVKGGNWKDVTVQQNEFTGLGKAISVNDIHNVKFLNNYIHDYRSDAFFLKYAADTALEGNIVESCVPYHLPKGQGDHPDMLQGMGFRKVTIRNNYFNERIGSGSQGIFIFGQDRKIPKNKADWKPGNVLVENNIIVVSMGNGICLGSLPDSIVRNNTLLYAQKSLPKPNAFTRMIIGGEAKNVLLEKNLVDRIRFGSKDTSGIIQKDNKIIQNDNPDAPDYYNALFAGKPADGPVRLGDLKPVKALDAGADFTPFEKYLKKSEEPANSEKEEK